MFISTRSFKSIAKAAVLALTLTLFSVVGGASAQAATTVYINDTDAPLAFVKSNSTNLIGTGVAVNDVVLYKTVGTYGGVAIDAVITTLSVSGSISNYDNPGSASTAAGAANNWMINTVGGEARFRFEFFRSGTYTGANTGIPVVLQNVKITSIDLDCSSSTGSYQYTDATGFQKYAMMSPTNLAVQTVASTNRVRFIANKTGSRSSVPEDQVMLKYDAVQTIEFSFGNVVAGQTNYFGLVFGGWPNGGVPTEYTNVFNTPPTSSDTTLNAANGVATILSKTNFGNYADADNNPFMAVKIGTVSGGTLQVNINGTWTNVSANQVITVADIEAGKVRFTPSGASSIQFWVYDGLDYSTNPYTITGTLATNGQTITFNNPGTKGVGDGSFASGATASSGLTVTLVSLTPGVCTVSGLNIVPVSAGTCIIVAKQPGDSTYGSAPEVTQEFQIVAGAAPTLTQVITFNQPSDQSLDTATVASGAISNVSDSTTLTPTLISNTPATCSVTGLTINILAVGTCTITASHPGTAAVAPATNVVRSFNITAVAGGGTVPATQTWGSSIVTGGGQVHLHGYVETNGTSTTYLFCYTENKPASTSTKILVGGSNASLYCTSTSTAATDGAVETADISYSSSNTSSSRINSGATVYFQIIAYHSSTNKVYGQIMKIQQGAGYIKTTAPGNITQTSATLNGTAKNTSSKSSRNLYFCLNAKYSVINYYQLANSDGKCDQKLTSNPASLNSGSSTSSAYSGATSLIPNTYYYYQIYMVSSSSKSSYSSYGNIVRFKTSAASPEATTLGTTGYTTSGATLTGSILSNDNSVTPKFCYSETPTASAGVLSEGNCIGGLVLASPETVAAGTVGVTRIVTGLTTGHTYYYQTVGVYNGSSKVYGAIKSFTLGAPAATTLSASGVKVTSGTSWEAQLNGFIKPNGGTSTNYFCLAETNTVTAKGQMTSCVTGGGAVALETATAETLTNSGSISLSKTGLTAGVTYYFQAIGRNLAQSPSLDNFGEVLSFITASAPSVTTEDVLVVAVDTATVRGTMTANGALTTGSFCISTSNAATVIDGVLDSCLFVIPSSALTTTTTANTTGDAVGLSQATTYYYQQIGDNAMGTSYGTIKSFTTLAGAPVVTTVAASDVLSTSATLNGRVNPGGASTTVKFCYHTSNSTDSSGKITGCTLTDTVTVLAGTAGLTSLFKNVDSLTVNTTYYFQVVAYNVVAGVTNTTYGAVLNFKTGAPIVQTLSATSVTGTTAVLNGTVKANGSNITSVSFCLATDSTVSGRQISNCSPAGTTTGSATPGTFSASITIANPESSTASGLTSGTTYYFQIIAQNAQGTSYGDVLSFVAGAPIGVTKPATLVTGSTARLNGTVNRNGDSGTTATFCLSDAEDIGADGSLASCIATTDVDFTGLSASTSTDIAVFVDSADLVAGNTYFFQIKASGTNGTSIGEVLSFSTGYTVQFLANGGSGSMSDQSAVSTTALTSNAYTKSGSTFSGWSRTSGGSVEFADGASYDFQANLTLYAIWTAAATPAPTVTKKKPTLNWSNPSPIKQGTPLSGTQLNAITDVPSVCVYSPALGSVLPAGTYTLSVTCTPNDPNYEPISGTVTLIVKGKVKPQILWFNPQPIVNPTPLTGTQLNALANVPGKYTYNPPAGTVLAPGQHPLNVKFTPDNREDNEDMEANVTIEVLDKKDAKPVVPPSKPASLPDTKTATTPAPAVILQTAGKSETITVRQNDEKTGIIVSAQNWSLAIKSTTQFVQGTVEDTSARVVIEKGNTVTTSGTGFKPFSQVDVWVYSTPTWLGAVMTDQFGNFTTTLPMPNALPEGDHTFQAKGQTPESTERVAAIPITLVPATVVNKPGSLRFEVYFGMNSPIVTAKEKARVTKLVQYAMKKIASGSKITVEIDGWVQPNPNPGDIKYLSTHRAKNTANVLRALGLKGIYTLKYPGLAKDNIPAARHASVIIKWSKSK